PHSGGVRCSGERDRPSADVSVPGPLARGGGAGDLGADPRGPHARPQLRGGRQAHEDLLGGRARRCGARRVPRHPAADRRLAAAGPVRADRRRPRRRLPRRRAPRRGPLLGSRAPRRIALVTPQPHLLRTPPGEPLAWVVRGRVAESVHTGHLLVTSAGGDRLVLAGGSHAGTPAHVEVARSVLRSVGLDDDALQNTPDWPLDREARSAVVRSGAGPASITQNCSGKHAAMLATCVAAGWSTADYRSPDHPLQRAIAEVVAEVSGVRPGEVTVDGCGAPLFSGTLRGLARGLSALVDAEPGTHEHRIAHVMRSHPELVAGEGRAATE